MKNLFILLILMPLCAFSQEKRESLWSVDAFYAPDTYYQAPLAGSGNVQQESAYRIGFNITLVSDKFPHRSLRTGLRYAVYNTNTTPTFNGSNLPLITRFDTNIFYEIPLAFRYTVGKNALKGYGELILSSNFGANSSRIKTHLNWGFSVGVAFSVAHQLAIYVQPTFRKPFGRINGYFFSTGIEIGLKFRFQDY
jgi:hypothetical protein